MTGTCRKDLATVKQFCAAHPFISEAGMRYKIYRRNTNGFKQAFVKLGSRRLIDVEEFFKCIGQHTNTPGK
jgi:hypothetical protein